MPSWRCFNHAVCGSSRPRASPNSLRCSGSACKTALTAQRQGGSAAPTEGLGAAVALPLTEEMPDGMSVNEVEEILGERCCKPGEMSKKKRKNGPGQDIRQQFLVRGTFLQPPDDDEDDQEDDTPEPDTFWVDKDDLLATIDIDDVKDALKLRHQQLLAGLRPAKKGRSA